MRKCFRVSGLIALVLLIIYAIISIIVVVPYWKPMKYAVHIENVSDYKGSIIIKAAFHTGTGWEIIGDENGYFTTEMISDVALTGVKLPSFGTGEYRLNEFLCIVEKTGTIVLDGEVFEQYKVIDWYPIYPVRRETILIPSWFFPKDIWSEKDN